MEEQKRLSEKVSELELLLVRQFRLLQELIEKSHKERKAILNGEDILTRLVEDKEALLDQLNLVENERRKVVQEIMVALNIRVESSSVKELIPHLDPETGTRISRLSDGMNSLVWQARDLNHDNQLLANVRLDWVKSAQSMLIELAQPGEGYRPPASGKASLDSPGVGLEFRV
jgi:flagellar biosynthesis/type III secretory pathway chaperone